MTLQIQDDMTYNILTKTSHSFLVM